MPYTTEHLGLEPSHLTHGVGGLFALAPAGGNGSETGPDDEASAFRVSVAASRAPAPARLAVADWLSNAEAGAPQKLRQQMVPATDTIEPYGARRPPPAARAHLVI